MMLMDVGSLISWELITVKVPLTLLEASLSVMGSPILNSWYVKALNLPWKITLFGPFNEVDMIVTPK